MTSDTKLCLLNPGPVTLTPRVRNALLRPDLCHREPEYAALQGDVRTRLASVYPETARDYAAVLLTGSGTAAVEAMVGSLIPRDGKALVVANGVYGERMASMLEVQGKAFAVVRSEWTDPLNLEEVERKLTQDGAFTHVLTVHHETTTGRLNDLASLGKICRVRGVALLLDAVSSFAGERIEFANWNIEGCAATANKCLHGVPGISLVLVRKDAFDNRTSGACSLYLDLFRNYKEQCGGYPLYTPAVQVLYALQEALQELHDLGGWERRHQHYRSLSQCIRTGFTEQGVSPLLSDERAYSSILGSFLLPAGVVFQNLYIQLKEAGFVIYPGQSHLKESIFRVAVMGDLQREDMERFLSTFAQTVGRERLLTKPSGS